MRGMGMGAGMAPARRRRGGRFNPAALFSAGEQGYWLDSSDFSTMFQDTAGATPVTAVGQSVRLMLDKSKGLVLGPELVTNGTFATNNNTGWTRTADFGWDFSGGSALHTGTAGGRIRQAITTVVGKRYMLQFDLDTTGDLSLANTSVFVRNSADNNSIAALLSANLTPNAVRSHVLYFTATDTTHYVAFYSEDTAALDNVSVREVPGNHFTQTSTSNAPILQQDAGGRYFLLFDGTDDWLQSGTITPGTDKVQVFAGVRKLSDLGNQTLVEVSAAADTSNGAFFIRAPTAGLSNYQILSRGTSNAATTATGIVAPITNVLTGIGDIAADTAILRVNGTQAASSPADQGTGNYLAYPHYIGRRGGASLPFNGRIYQLICRFGPNLTAAQIQQVETFVNQRTGAY